MPGNEEDKMLPKSAVYDSGLEFYFNSETRKITATCPECKNIIELHVNSGTEKILAPCLNCSKIFLVTKILTPATKAQEGKLFENIIVGTCPFCYGGVKSALKPDGSFESRVFCNKFQRYYYLNVESTYDYKLTRIYSFCCEVKPWNSEKIQDFFFRDLDGKYNQIADGFVFRYKPQAINTAKGSNQSKLSQP